MKELINNFLKDIKMTKKYIKRKNLSCTITLIVELIKVILTLIFIPKLSFITSTIIFGYAIISSLFAIFLLNNDDYNDFKKYIILDLSTLIFFISNIISGILIESISYEADIKFIRKINKKDKKIKKIPIYLEHKKVVYIYLFISLLICYEKLYINGYLFLILSFISIVMFFIDDIKKSIKEFIKNKERYIKYILKNYFIILLITNAVSLILYWIIGDISTNEQLLKEEPIWRLLLTSIIYAPIFEELLFRGCLRKIIKNDIAFILISGIGFGFWHVVGFEQSLLQYLYIIPYSVMGIGLSYIYAKTNNLTTNIGMHALHNILANISNLL